MQKPHGPTKRTALALLGILALIVLTACHHNTRVVTPAAPSTQPEAAPAPPPAPPTCNLTAEPATVEKGGAVTLSWSSQNGTDFNLDPNLGKQLAEGSLNVTPADSTTYVLTVSGPAGNTTCTARVTMTAPAAPPKPTVAESNIEEGFDTQIKDAYFDLDRADLRADAEQALTSDASFLKAHPDIKITIEGHCDERGSEEYNLGLGDRRATAGKTFLANLGVDGSRITTISFGKTRPFCADRTEECWQQNRRDHLVSNKQ